MPLLTLDELRTFVTSSLEDDALQAYLDAAEAAIVERYGPTGPVTEVLIGGSSVVALKRPVEIVESISETIGDTTTELAEDDYLFSVGSAWISRSVYGTNYGSRWGDRLEVTYTPVDDTAERIRVAVKLVQLELNNHPGLTGQVIGDWSETYAANSVFNYGIEREAILASLGSRAGALFA